MPSKEKVNTGDKVTPHRQPAKPTLSEPVPLEYGRVPDPVVVRKGRSAPHLLSARNVLHLQRTVGNQAVGRILGSVRQQQAPRDEFVQENNTGLPDRLKAGVENLSGISIDDVQVHYNSSKPAQLGALAYTQGNDIHVAPRQEQHLPHEAWHVVQQKQGRVKPTLQMAGMQINDEKELETEAEIQGNKAHDVYTQAEKLKEDESSVLQLKDSVQSGNMQPCVQLTINMRGHVYTRLLDFAEAYAKHFSIKPWKIPTLVWNYIKYAFQNNGAFLSYNQLLSQVLVGANNYLPLTPIYVDTNSRNTINMTGSRQMDKNAADQVYNNTRGWIWHHIEGITYNGQWQCDMILVDPNHHKQNHVGAVQQWEQATGGTYQ